MKGDFSRNTFDSTRYFTRVLMQQGRVQLDADWNEQVDIFWHFLRTLFVDLVGPHGGPEEIMGPSGVPEANQGFQIEPDGNGGFTIGYGRYYVNGILCENYGDEGKEPITYSDQPYYRDPPDLPDLPYLVYLDVWERHITCIEDDSIREIALGASGPDTASRSKVIWQVKAGWPENFSDEDGAGSPWEQLEKELRGSQGTLRAKALETRESDDACLIAPDARYRGAENQLYRVEIHNEGKIDETEDGSAPTFKWSRDNGSVVFPVRRIVMDSESGIMTVTLTHLGRDNVRFGLTVGDWVELVDDDYVLKNEAAPLLMVIEINPVEASVKLKNGRGISISSEQKKHPLLRRWDHEAHIKNGGVVKVETGKCITLEDGVQVYFGQGIYRTGDYWLIPARVMTGNVEWPRVKNNDGKEVPQALPPRGIRHYYAPLLHLYRDGAEIKRDEYRHIFAPIPAP